MIVVESHGVVLIDQGNDQMFFSDINAAVGVFTHVNLFLAGNRIAHEVLAKHCSIWSDGPDRALGSPAILVREETSCGRGLLCKPLHEPCGESIQGVEVLVRRRENAAERHSDWVRQAASLLAQSSGL